MLVSLGRLKRAYGKLVEMMVVGNNRIDKQYFLSLYPNVHETVFMRKIYTVALLEQGFRPPNEERFLAKITFPLHTPTPPPSLVESSVSSTFQTSQSSHQLDHKLHSLTEKS